MTISAIGIKQRRRRRLRRAFTLLELLLVLALLAILAAISWPSLYRSLDTQRLKGAADLVRTNLLRARTKAITSGEIVSFKYQLDGGQFRVEQQSNDNAILASGGMATGGMTGGAAGQGGASSQTSAAGATPVDPLPPVEDKLPDGVTFKPGEVGTDSRMGYVSINDRFTSINDASWSQPILFFPDGTATWAKIRVLGERGRSIEIEVRSLTGGVTVGEIIRGAEAAP
ncbi:MAG TPA: prepilin-type N-terminal cleavage/methylation domain-containing protein [Pirellulales bacterium]|nr:prepilin-type N-terminal cleavage/methylation domain-containing protein [Pirellulales bacterium]